MYAAFETAGKKDKYQEESDKWRKRMSADNPAEVVKAMTEFVVKLEAAAAKKKAA